VLLNNQHPNEFSYSVRIDNTQGTFDATNHLLSRGHRHIGYLGDKFGLHSDAERRAGFQKAMQDAGVEVPSHLFLSGDGKMEGAIHALLSLFGSEIGGEQLPTALICYNDMSALGVMEAAKRLRYSIPGDLSIVGFDDIQVAELVTPGLTTVRQPKRQLGMRAMGLLLKLLGGEEAERSVVLPGELVIRGSTAPVAG
jgi:DNA-binding LacI/PurR family transcriptional regulator